nr:hypothetical protein [Streptomyces diastatochromogenes]
MREEPGFKFVLERLVGVPSVPWIASQWSNLAERMILLEQLSAVGRLQHYPEVLVPKKEPTWVLCFKRKQPTPLVHSQKMNQPIEITNRPREVQFVYLALEIVMPNEELLVHVEGLDASHVLAPPIALQSPGADDILRETRCT